jgi:outer membrane protein TolC
VARNQWLPRLDASARLAALGADPTLGGAFNQAWHTRHDQYIVGLTGEIPLGGNQSGLARIRQASLTRLQTMISQQRVKVMVTEDVYNAADQVEFNFQLILEARQATVAAARAYAGELRQFERGLRTSTDVLIALTNVADAQTVEINAIVQYQIAKVNLAVATGTMLGYSRVNWPTRPEDVRLPKAPPH